MSYDKFVIPFSAGLLFLVIFIIYKFSSWIRRFPSNDKKAIKNGFFSTKTLKAIREAIMESLLHRRIFRVNPVLGYMHCTFALGWFLLIVVGNIESRLHAGREINLPFYPIFFKFFVHDRSNIPFSKFFTFTMDFILLAILSGLLIAMSKRFYSRITGMKKTTKMKLMDRLALTTLWFIFPLRLIAESTTSGIFHTGNFLTDGLGRLFGESFSQLITYPAWWAYSTSLGLFFISLPFSRYMHIPTEILFIALKKYGITQKDEFFTFSEIAVNSCPRCGICIDICQLASYADINNIQSVYFLRSIRENNMKEGVLTNCLLCGRCKEYCPVGIDLDNIRIAKRKEMVVKNDIPSFSYLKILSVPKTDYLYFAGCMTHLTPKIKHSVQSIFFEAGVDYQFMDKDASMCCGRPLKMAGFINKANELASKNKEMIYSSGAKVLVTSCPICYRTFREDYNLDISVIHHSKLLTDLVKENRIKLTKNSSRLVYHDPCELGRGSGIFEEPRDLILNISEMVNHGNQKEDSLCCGGCVGDLNITDGSRQLITMGVLEGLTINSPDKIITSCPLCKKTLSRYSDLEVLDIAEVVEKSMIRN